MDMADHMVSDGFKKAGYEYVNIDVSELVRGTQELRRVLVEMGGAWSGCRILWEGGCRLVINFPPRVITSFCRRSRIACDVSSSRCWF